MSFFMTDPQSLKLRVAASELLYETTRLIYRVLSQPGAHDVIVSWIHEQYPEECGRVRALAFAQEIAG